MSKTDKTRPYWVKLLQDPQVRKEYHNHQKGVCNITFSHSIGDIWRYSTCGYWVTYDYDHLGFWKRRSKAEQVYRTVANRSSRTKLRNQMSDARKWSLDDICDYDSPTFRNRHSALWNSD